MHSTLSKLTVLSATVFIATALTSCSSTSRVEIDLAVKDAKYANYVLQTYNIDASVDSSTGKITVPSEQQQKASMILTFKGLVATDDSIQVKQIEQVDTADYLPLKIPPTDPRAAVLRLATYGIHAEHEIVNHGVLVHKCLEQQAAMVLTFTGMLPNGREAYGFLTEDQLAKADRRTRMEYITCLQDMLADSISGMPGISQCEVILTGHAKPWEFRKTDSELTAKARVKVQTTNGGRMTEEQQFAITSLVSRAFTTLSKSDVRISDFDENYYPTIDASWQMNFTVQTRQRQLQREAERKIEFQLAQYKAKAAATIPMKVPSAEVQSRATEKVGSSGQEMDAGRDAVNDPGRKLDQPTSKQPAEVIKRHPEADYPNASAAITVISATTLSVEEINRLKNHAARASGIPAANISIQIQTPDSTPSTK